MEYPASERDTEGMSWILLKILGPYLKRREGDHWEAVKWNLCLKRLGLGPEDISELVECLSFVHDALDFSVTSTVPCSAHQQTAVVKDGEAVFFLTE